MVVAAGGARQADGTPAQSAEFFEARIRPILAANCYECHGDDEKGGLRLDSREALIKGGDSGTAIVPGKPDDSLLIKAVRHATGAPKMPKSRPQLKAEDIDALVAVGERRRAVAGERGSAGSRADARRTHRAISRPSSAAFWSFQPLHRTPPPAVRDAAWAKGDIDRFILARLEKDGMRPVEPADKLTLIRRATLDLTGLPPTPEEVDAFERDSSAGAFAKVVDRLLASPRYGETWGRLWLDVARYGEDDYRSLDPKGRGLNPYPNAYLYRDWVIKAFNDDLPYDQFVKAQLAADLLDEPHAPAHAAGARVSRSWPVVLRQRRRRDHACRRAARSGRRGRPWSARPDGRLRALPRPQVRSDSDARLLLAGRRLPQHRVSRVPAGARVGRRRVQGAGEEDREEGRPARRVPRERIPAAGRNARVPGVEVHAGGLEGRLESPRPTEIASSNPASWTTSSSTAGCVS